MVLTNSRSVFFLNYYYYYGCVCALWTHFYLRIIIKKEKEPSSINTITHLKAKQQQQQKQ